MTKFLLIHGGGGTAAGWRRVQSELLQRGGVESVAVDLPSDDPEAPWADYVRSVLADERVRRGESWIVVGHSAGGFTAPLVCEPLDAKGLILLAGMIPKPGEKFMEWWGHTDHRRFQKLWFQEKSLLESRIEDDDYVFYHDVAPDLTREEKYQGEARSYIPTAPLPLVAWPEVPTSVVAFENDRFFPPPFMARIAQERLGLDVASAPGGHVALLSNPKAVADALLQFAGSLPSEGSPSLTERSKG